jgi:hypothetical protein
VEVESSFEPVRAVQADLADYKIKYAGLVTNYRLSSSISLSRRLSCQCPILVCKYSGFYLKEDLSRLI